MEKYETGTGQIISVHNARDCKGPHCPIHNPSDHCMRDFPTHWRDDRQIMERICPHGIGHPDPDDYKIRMGEDRGVHGCDGCCTEGGYPISKTFPTVPISDHFEPGPALKDIVPEIKAIPTRTMNPDDVLVLKLPKMERSLPKRVMERFIKNHTDRLKKIFPGQKILVLTDGADIEIQKASNET